MQGPWIWGAVALGGALGAMGRFGVGIWATRHLHDSLPFGTLIVNILGSFLMGALIDALALKWEITPELRAFLVVGFLGAFTTFSTFSLDAVALVQRQQTHLALLYIAASVLGGIAALYGGMRLIRLLLSGS